MNTAAASLDTRTAVRLLASGVTVLTVLDEDTVHGTTVSSVSVVSRDPVLVCAGLRRGSLLTELAVHSGTFAVNVLSSRQALIADWFANPDRPAGRRQFDLVDWVAAGGRGIPLLRNALAVLVCRLVERVPAGDNDLLLAEVFDGSVGIGRPLVNFDGGLHDVELHDVARRRGWRSLTGAAATSFE